VTLVDTQPEAESAESAESAAVSADAATAARWSPPALEAAFWAAHLAFWGGVYGALVLVVSVYRPQPLASPALLAVRVAACLVATAGIRALSKQRRLLERLNATKTGLVGGGLLSAAVAITLALALAESLLAASPVRPSRARLVADLAINVTLLANWCALYFGAQLLRERTSAEFRAVEAESLALRNELHRLQAQISPHFLFNALNTVLASRDDPEAIETVTQSLAKYLRFLLRPAAVLEPLSRELDALEEYLTVQAARFGDGLVTRIDCALDVRDLPVPPVLVQPLVENALKYGAESGPRPLRVEVMARREGEWLAIDVANTGRWVTPGRKESTGTGLASLERRLRMLVGPTARVQHDAADGWVRVRVRIPLGSQGNGSQGR